MTKYSPLTPVEECIVEKDGKWFHLRYYDSSSLDGSTKTYEEAFVRLVENDLT